MSTEDKRPRRRIAGEKPAAGQESTPPRVVKRPVVRPPSVAPQEPAPQRPATGGATASESTPSDGSDDGSSQPPSREAEAPRIVPAGRKQRTTSTSPVPQTAAPLDAPDPDASGAEVRAPLVVGVVLAALLAVALAGVSIVWAAQQVAGADVETAQTEAADAAATAAETILGYRYDQLEQHLEESQALMTPEYGEDFESLSPALNDLAPQRQIVVEAAAREVAPLPCGSDCSDDRVEVLVFVDQARVVADDPEPTVFGNRISLTMVRDGDDWLVDDIEAY